MAASVRAAWDSAAEHGDAGRGRHHARMRSLRCAAMLMLAAIVLPAQGRVLDVIDGETLYEGGSLVSFSVGLERQERLRQGSESVADPTASHRFTVMAALAYQYGLRNDLQIGIALPYVDVEREFLGGQEVTAGLGDVELLAKWRFRRWDAPRVAVNTALIAMISLPTGADDDGSGGVEFEPEQQVGSGGVDPSIGWAITAEPARWRFNLAAIYRIHTDTDGDGDQLGDAFFAELAVGNRFWLEPYPGPFMRLDVFAHYDHENRDAVDGQLLADTGGERVSVGATWAFRPRPSLDFQLTGEVPVWHDVNGTQLDQDWSVQFSFGYRF
jgi:hypothetical protein